MSVLRSKSYLLAKTFLTFSFSLLTVCAFAQQQYTFTNYTQEQGLRSGTISGIYKDTTGYLWLTSEEGIARFDGYNFKVFRHNPDDCTNGILKFKTNRNIEQDADQCQR